MSSILVVEDFEDSRFSLCRLLEMAGHEVYEATTGVEGVSLAIEHRPDLILMDLSLPDISGTAAIERIRASEGAHHVPIIVLSAHDAEPFRTEAIEAGCDGYLTKPLDFEELEKTIAEHIG